MNIHITENVFESGAIPRNGNKFLTGNGYLGLRGVPEECLKEHLPALNLAGVYDRVGKAWRESVNAPNPLFTRIAVNGLQLTLPETEPVEHSYDLDIVRAVLNRRTVWQTEEGRVCVETERFVSMADRHLVGLKYTVSADFDCDVTINSGIDGDVWDINGPHFVKMDSAAVGDNCTVTGVTGEKEIRVAVGAKSFFDFDAEPLYEAKDKYAGFTVNVNAESGKKYTFTKLAYITTSLDAENLLHSVPSDISKLGYDEALAEHVAAWAAIWESSEVKIDGDKKAEDALNYSIYHLNCIAPRGMVSMSIPARGLSGQVYKGAIFWDTEMFMIDYYLFTEPEIVRSILKYRIRSLPGARRKAAEYGYKGAFYAWESQENGDDACSTHNVTDVFTGRPMRTYFRDGQIHVCSAIVYAFKKYIDITGDTSILDEGGREVLDECAKFYCSRMVRRYGSDKYELHDVVGPDEYHERVNNNAYTNAMARLTLEVAAQYTGNDEYRIAAESIYIPAADGNGVIEQFDGYFALEDCSVQTVRSRLIDPTEYWGGAYGVAADTKVIKQADVVAMLCMLPEGHSREEMYANLKYYEPRTEHGSSLSACMYASLSCMVGEPDYAYPLFMKSATADLVPGVKEWIGPQYIGGTHPAASGGAWKVAIYGFAGVTVKDGRIVCDPHLPCGWTAMHFTMALGGKRYAVDINGDEWSVTEK